MKKMLSDGNSKIGSTPSFNFAPIIFCDRRFPCTHGDCYNLRESSSFVRFAVVREAWTRHALEYLAHPEEFISRLRAEIFRTRREYFRWFTSGDIPDEKFAHAIVDIAHENPEKKFLLYTKKYEMMLPYKGSIPENLVVRFSAWYPIEVPADWSWYSWVEIDPRVPQNAFRCREKCEACGRVCWRPQVKHIKLKLI